MEGVEILSTIRDTSGLWFGIILFGFLSILCVIGVWAEDAVKKKIIAAILSVVCLLSVYGCIYGIYNIKPEYQVLISDDVGYKEFTEKYEVIGVKGKVYTVKNRYE